jgi:hypothetical protein
VEVVNQDPTPQFNIYYFEVAVTGGGGQWQVGYDTGEAFSNLVRLGVTPGVNTFTVTVPGIGSVTFTETGE